LADAWSYSATTGWTLSNASSDRIVRISKDPAPPSCEVLLSLKDTASQVATCLFVSKDTRSRWEFWADSVSGVCYTQFINGVEWGTGTVSLGAHSVATAVDYYLTVQKIGKDIVIKVTSGTTAEVKYNHTLENDDLADNTSWGFSAAANGASVLRALNYALEPANATRAEILNAVGGGILYSCSDEAGVLLKRIGRVAGTTGPVGIAEYNGDALIVGGGLANRYKPILESLEPWYDEKHDGSLGAGKFSTLPGATQPSTTASADYTKGRGTTGATIIEVHNDRIFLSGWSERPDVVFASAAGNQNSFILDNIELGDFGAYTITVSDTVTCLKTLPSQNLLIGAKSKMFVHLGDPSFGRVDTPQVSNSGITGPRSTETNDESVVVIHSTGGLYKMTSDSLIPQNITQTVLTDGIQIDPQRLDDYKVSMVRDPEHGRLHIFLTKVEVSNSIHFYYDDRVGGYRDGAGFMFPEIFPDIFGPTAAVRWRGKIVMGTRNGLLVTYDQSKKSDVTGLTTRVPVSSWMTMTLRAVANPVGDTIIESWRVQLSKTSSAIGCRVYGGATPEDLYSPDATILFSCSVEPYGPPYGEVLRSPAIALYLFNDGTEERYWELEQVVGSYQTGTMVSLAPRKTPTTPKAPTRAPVVVTTSTTPPSGTGSGGPGSGSSPPGDGYGGGSPPGGGGVSSA